ncbi:MAG: hypothetical protein AB7I27_07985 [Bacteriovoracaceae bacterium]
MNRQNYPQYVRAINFYLACDNLNFNRLIETHQFSHCAKQLLLCRKKFSQGDFAGAIGLLEELHSFDSDFFRAEKFLLLATAHSNLGNWEDAFLNNMRAHGYYKNCDDQRGLFLSSYNISVDAGYMGLKKISSEYLNKSSHFAANLDEVLLIHRARACELSQIRKYKEAKQEILKALELCSSHKDAEKNKLDILTLKVVASDIFFRATDPNNALNILEEIKHEKLLKPKARVHFNLSLIKFLEGKKLGKMPRVVSSSEEYSLKWIFLNSLETGDMIKAQELWDKLQANFPAHFKENFSCTSKYHEESIFYQAVLRIRGKVKKAPSVNFPLGSKMEILHKCLSQAKAPLRKEELIETIWKKPYGPNYDARFYKLIQRLKELSLPIVNEQRAYFYKF